MATRTLRKSIFSTSKKKGQVQDILFFGVVGFVMAIVILIGYRLLKDINTQFQASDVISTTAKANLNSYTNNFSTIFDAIYAMAIFLLAVILVISVFMIDTHPIFFAVSIPLFLAVLFVNVVLANALDDVGQTSGLAAYYAEFEMMNFIASHWIATISIVGFLTLTIFYAKGANA